MHGGKENSPSTKNKTADQGGKLSQRECYSKMEILTYKQPSDVTTQQTEEVEGQ